MKKKTNWTAISVWVGIATLAVIVYMHYVKGQAAPGKPAPTVANSRKHGHKGRNAGA